MTTLSIPHLLRQTLRRCNAHGTAIAGMTLAVGLLLLACDLLVPRQLLLRTTDAARPLLGELPAQQMEERIRLAPTGTDDLNRAGTDLAVAIEQAIRRLPEAEQTAALGTAGRALIGTALTGLVYLAFLIVLQLFVHTWTLFTVQHAPNANTSTTMRSIRLLPKMIALWIAMIFISGVWASVILIGMGMFVPFLMPVFVLLSLVVPFLLLPRVLTAPAFLVEKGSGIAAALRQSWLSTEGRYRDALSAFIGMQVATIVVLRIAGFAMVFLQRAVAVHSPYAPVLGMTLVFLGVVATVFRSAYIVEMRAELK